MELTVGLLYRPGKQLLLLGQRVFYSVDLPIYYMGILLMLMTKRPGLVSNDKSTICKRGNRVQLLQGSD